MKLTVNLYSGKKYSLEEVKKQVEDKNPVVFIVPNESNESVFSMMNISNSLKKYICVANSFDAPKVVAYLVSFKDLSKLNVLLMAPSGKRNKSLLFANKVSGCVNRANMIRGFKIR